MAPSPITCLPRRSSSGAKAGGFALIITITLLAFLLLVMVGLATFTKVETNVADNAVKQAQARQNALMALNIALGQLQKHAGPDARVSARAELLPAIKVGANPYFTGIWDAATTDQEPFVWLVSGNEGPSSGDWKKITPATALDPSTSAASDQVFLLDAQSVAATPANPTSAELARRIKLARQPITASGSLVPGAGAASQPRVGSYAWWIGDLGVKASLGLPDRADDVAYAPWSTSTGTLVQRRRIRQQIASMPNYFRPPAATTTQTGVTKEGFDPLMATTTFRNTLTTEQLGFQTPVTDIIGNYLRGHYHDFTGAAYAVLANTRTDTYRGLMGDLSIDPSQLGAAFVAYSGFDSTDSTQRYMETPGTTSGSIAAIPAITDADSPRRRYLVQKRTTAAPAGLPAISFSVAPVLSDFLVQCYLRCSSASAVEARVRVYASLWNPYSVALVPPTNLSLIIEGLPTVSVTDNVTHQGTSINYGAASVPGSGGGKIQVSLPFGKSARASSSSGFGQDGELASWLPGRKYSWVTASGSGPSAALAFYTATVNVTGWSWNVSAAGLTGAAAPLSASIPSTTLKVTLLSGSDVLAVYTPSVYPPDTVTNSEDISTPAPAGTGGTTVNKNWRFGFAFRLKQPAETDADRSWLSQYDPRTDTITSSFLLPFDDQNDWTPTAYRYDPRTVTGLRDYLIYRVQGSGARSIDSYNDASLFELPRLPLLSTGELQQLQVSGQRPFSFGNSWGGAANSVFDRFFFSGLTATTATPSFATGQPLPNWNLRPVGVNDAATLKAAGALSSRYLVQAGGFNVNSVSQAAWRAALSSVRFRYISSDATSGFVRATIETAVGANEGTQSSSTAVANESFNLDQSLGTTWSAPAFFRLPQSAQEIHAWKDPQQGTTIPPDGDPSTPNQRTFRAEAFRWGLRGYTAENTSTNNDTNYPTSTSFPQAPLYSAANGRATPLTSLPAASKTGPNLQHLTTDQVEALAAEIVARIKAKTTVSGPFRSLQEFLGPLSGGASLLETAIDAARVNADQIRPLAIDPSSSKTYPGFSTLTLSQADLLNALAPYLRTRSDTFVVRAYGDVLNPATQETFARAWLEAVVQRLPSTVDPADNIQQPSLSGSGRQFKIISLRWLQPSEI